MANGAANGTQGTAWRQGIARPAASAPSASACTDGGGGQETGKKIKFGRTCGPQKEDVEDLWDLLKNLGWKKKASVCKTYKNDEVSNLNEEKEKAMETLAVLYERFEQVNSDLVDIDKKFDKAKRWRMQWKSQMNAASDTRGLYAWWRRRVTMPRSRSMKGQAARTKATSAMSLGTGNRAEMSRINCVRHHSW